MIVDNVPKVGPEKYARLCDVIRKLYSVYGKVVPDGFYVPTEGNPATSCG